MNNFATLNASELNKLNGGVISPIKVSPYTGPILHPVPVPTIGIKGIIVCY